MALCLRFQWLLTLLRMILFVAAHRREGKKVPFPKICQTYPRRIKLGTIIPYLNKIQELCKSRDTIFEFCWHQHFSPEIRKFYCIKRNRFCLLQHGYNFDDISKKSASPTKFYVVTQIILQLWSFDQNFVTLEFLWDKLS